MTETYKKLLDSYRIIERVKNDLKNTTEEQLIKNYKGELNAINDYWSVLIFDAIIGLVIDAVQLSE